MLLMPFVLLGGRPNLKAFVAQRYVPDPKALKWRTEVLAFLREERSRGRKIVLATAAHRLVGEAIVSHLGLFDSLIATDRGVNVKGRRKAVQIRKALNCNEFDYIGDHMADVPVFEVARLSYLVAASPSLRAAATRVGRVEREFHLRSERFSTADPR
jgi:phosphoserine phosphatase